VLTLLSTLEGFYLEGDSEAIKSLSNSFSLYSRSLFDFKAGERCLTEESWSRFCLSSRRSLDGSVAVEVLVMGGRTD